MKHNDKLEREFAAIEAEVSAEKPLSLEHISDILNRDYPPIEWMVQTLMPKGSLVALSGAPATFKTFLALSMANALCKGTKFIDQFETVQTGVIIIDEESGGRILKQRLRNLGADSNLPLYFVSYDNFTISEYTIDQILEAVIELGIGLVIFDSLVRIHQADENDSVKMAQVFKLMRRITTQDISVLFLHHHKKTGGGKGGPSSELMRGSSDILAAVDIHIAVFKKDGVITLTQTKNRFIPEIPSFKVNIINEGSSIRFEYAGEQEKTKSKKDEWKEEIVELLESEPEPLNKTSIFNKLQDVGLEGGKSTYKKAIAELIAEKKVFMKKGAGNSDMCSTEPLNPPSMFE